MLLIFISMTPNIFATIYGDVDGNGIIDTADSLKVSRASNGLENLNDKEIQIADVDGDGKITDHDANYIHNKSVKIIDYFPVEIHKVTISGDSNIQIAKGHAIQISTKYKLSNMEERKKCFNCN